MRDYYHRNYYTNRPFKTRKLLRYATGFSLLRKFLGIDKRMRRNLLIGASLFIVVIFTGALLAIISLVQFGGNLIDEALGDLKNETRVERSYLQPSDIKGSDLRN